MSPSRFPGRAPCRTSRSPTSTFGSPWGQIFAAYGFERCLWGTDWTRAVELLTYEQGVEAFRVTDRLSDAEARRAHGRQPRPYL